MQLFKKVASTNFIYSQRLPLFIAKKKKIGFKQNYIFIFFESFGYVILKFHENFEMQNFLFKVYGEKAFLL